MYITVHAVLTSQWAVFTQIFWLIYLWIFS